MHIWVPLFLLLLSRCPGETAKVKDENEVIDMRDVLSRLTFDNLEGGAWRQGWPVTYDQNRWNQAQKLQVYKLPFSHNDPGWVKTFQQYFDQQTNGIITSVVNGLSQNPERTFIWSEISFFEKWWKIQDEQMREKTRRLLKNGQLEITNGGWVMNDEAAPHYSTIISQFLEGHRWLELNLGVKTKKAWSIDPFGHSSTMAYLHNLTGFESMIINRIHYRLKKEFAKNKWLEFYWRQNWQTRESNTDILTHIFPFFSYDIPHTCGPEPAVCSLFDFMKGITAWGGIVEPITDNNIHQRATVLVDQYKKKATLYRTNSLLVTLGDDFRYTTVSEVDVMMENHQKLHEYINSHPQFGVHIQFATLSDYLDNMQKDARSSGVQFPIVKGDFFTYADKDTDYWSGYFISRSFFKGLTRVVESLIRTAEILHSVTSAKLINDPRAKKEQINKRVQEMAEVFSRIEQARRTASLFQHHDGITGTAADFVVVDYGTMLHAAKFSMLETIRDLMRNSLSHRLSKDKPPSIVLHLDEEKRSFNDVVQRRVVELSSSSKPQSIILFNSLTRDRVGELISIFVSTPHVRVVDSQGQPVVAQLNPVWELKNGHPVPSTTKFRLFFKVLVPSLGMNMYTLHYAPKDTPKLPTIMICNSNTKQSFVNKEMEACNHDVFIENQHMKLYLDKQTGLMQKVAMRDKKTVKLEEEYRFYVTHRSGAYLFLPESSTSLTRSGHPFQVIRGPLVQEVVHLDLTALPQRTIRLYPGDDTPAGFIEVTTQFDMRQHHNQELIARFTTDIDNHNLFFTDLNGFSMQRRTTRLERPIQANYYPLSSTIFLQDTVQRISILTKQAFGGSSLSKGSLEIMLDRRLGQDDARGLNQPVTDNVPTETTFYLHLETRTSPISASEIANADRLSSMAHNLLHRLNHPVLLTHTNHELPSRADQVQMFPLALSNNMAEDIHLVSMKKLQSRLDDTRMDDIAVHLTRLPLDARFPVINSQDIAKIQVPQRQISLQSLFPSFKISRADEWTLTLMYQKEKNILSKQGVVLEPYSLKTYLLNINPLDIPEGPYQPPVEVNPPNKNINEIDNGQENQYEDWNQNKNPELEMPKGAKPELPQDRREILETYRAQVAASVRKVYLFLTFVGLASVGFIMTMSRRKRLGMTLGVIVTVNVILHLLAFGYFANKLS